MDLIGHEITKFPPSGFPIVEPLDTLFRLIQCFGPVRSRRIAVGGHGPSCVPVIREETILIVLLNHESLPLILSKHGLTYHIDAHQLFVAVSQASVFLFVE